MLAIVLIACTSACLTIEEEIWLKPDGSGLAKVKFIMPVSLFENEKVRRALSYQIPLTPERLRQKFSKMPGISVKNVDEYITPQKMRVMEADLAFDHIGRLSDKAVMYQLTEYQDTVTLTVTITRQHRKGAASRRKRKINIEEILEKNFQKYQIKFLVHFPTRIIQIENFEKAGKRDAKWHVSFSTIFKDGPPIKGKVTYYKEPNLWEKLINYFRFP